MHEMDQDRLVTVFVRPKSRKTIAQASSFI